MSDEQSILPEPGPSHRRASVKLEGQGAAGGLDQGPRLDPANQSLAEALGLVFRLLQLGMLGLFAYFALSGFQSIKENETGIRLVFGKPSGESLRPGFQYSYPFPVGEMIRVDTGERTLDINASFWPQLQRGQESLSLEQLAQAAAKYGLNPAIDGSLITGDQSLAHAQWRVRYSRARPVDFIQNINSEDEDRIVAAAVERGVVQAAAGVNIDDLLKQAPGDQGSIAQRAMEIAQASLDRIGSGLRIDQLTLGQKAPPFAVMTDFNGVQSAEQKASRQATEAETIARNSLSTMAGASSEVLVQQIDAYEQALAREDKPAQERILATINALFEGKEVDIGGEKVRTPVSGQVTAILNEARQYRSTVVSRRRTEFETYKAKLAQFRSNPDVVVQRDWADAMTTLLSRPNVDIWLYPPDTKNIVLDLNRDPRYTKLYDEEEKRRKLEADTARRMREAEQMRYRTNTNETSLDVR